MDFLTEESKMFDNRFNFIQAEFMEAIASSIEQIEKSNGYITEKKDESVTLASKTKAFFANIIATIQNFISTVQVELDKKVRAKEFRTKLRKLHNELKDAKNGGIKTVEVIDVWSMRSKYIDANNELKKYAKRFSQMKYTKTRQIDDDTTAFNTIIEKYKNELDESSKKTVVVPIDKMLDFVEDEISGRSKTLDTLNDEISLLQQMQKDCELIEKREEILGPDIIPKHVSFIRRIVSGITGLLKKWAVKIITTVVFIVG